MSNAGRVLVVEDHEVERRAVSQVLKAEGFSVFGAENADKALGYMDENAPINSLRTERAALDDFATLHGFEA